MRNKLIAEFIGTFFLFFTIGMAVIAPGAGALAPVAIGFALAAMIFAMGHISGAHYNPAVSIGLAVSGNHPKKEVLPYIAVQLIGATAAWAAVCTLKPDMPTATSGAGIVPIFLAELLFTFALVWVIHNVAVAKATAGNSFYGLAIGITVMAGAFAVGPVSGGAFNPAVTLGLCLSGLIPAGSIFIYLLAQIIGGIAAALLFRSMQLGEES